MNVQSRPRHSETGYFCAPAPGERLSVADHIMRVAFGTFFGVPDPASFMGDASYVGTRWKANPDAAFADALHRSAALLFVAIELRNAAVVPVLLEVDGVAGKQQRAGLRQLNHQRLMARRVARRRHHGQGKRPTLD